MQQKVSLWLGNFQNKEEFQNYFNILYTEDGDSLPSQFEKDFHLNYYDRDLVEKDWIDIKESDIHMLLEGFSYDEEIIPQFPNITTEYNTIVLIYDFDYSTDKKKVLENHNLEFIGVAEYSY